MTVDSQLLISLAQRLTHVASLRSVHGVVLLLLLLRHLIKALVVVDWLVEHGIRVRDSLVHVLLVRHQLGNVHRIFVNDHASDLARQTFTKDAVDCGVHSVADHLPPLSWVLQRLELLHVELGHWDVQSGLLLLLHGCGLLRHWLLRRHRLLGHEHHWGWHVCHGHSLLLLVCLLVLLPLLTTRLVVAAALGAVVATTPTVTTAVVPVATLVVVLLVAMVLLMLPIILTLVINEIVAVLLVRVWSLLVVVVVRVFLIWILLMILLRILPITVEIARVSTHLIAL